MPGSYPDQSEPGLFLPTTDVYDTQIIQSLDVNSQEFKEFLVRLRQSINNVAFAINYKDSGYYPLTEFVNGQVLFPDVALDSTTPAAPVWRQMFRLVVNFGPLPNAGTTAVPHNIVITNTFRFTRIYATASDPVGLNFIPIPYASPVLANNIELRVDAVNVYITTGINRTNFTTTYVILEYIKG